MPEFLKGKRRTINEMYSVYVTFYIFMFLVDLFLFIVFPASTDTVLWRALRTTATIQMTFYAIAVWCNVTNKSDVSLNVVHVLMVLQLVNIILLIPGIMASDTPAFDGINQVTIFFLCFFVLNFRRIYLKEIFARVKELGDD
jgi:hypothetical protein